MKIPVLIILSLFIGSLVFAQSDIKVNRKAPLNIGEKVEIRSRILNENRQLNIYLPNAYSPDSLKKYPVIYLLDGSIDEDFIHIAGLVQFGSFSWINILPESIVVGISNIDRKRDFTFPSNSKLDQKEFPTSGKSKNFIQYIDNEVQTYIEQNYKVNNTKTLIGQSLGGLLVTEILYTNPEMFDNYIIVSPSLWWDDGSVLKTRKPDTYTSAKSIYIGVGKEGYGMEDAAEALYNKLKAIKGGNTTLHFEYFEKQDHGDALHLAVYDAFEKIFKTKEE